MILTITTTYITKKKLIFNGLELAKIPLVAWLLMFGEGSTDYMVFPSLIIASDCCFVALLTSGISALKIFDRNQWWNISLVYLL